MSNLGYVPAAGGSGGGAVSSVAGRTGAVTLAASDVAGAASTYTTQSKTANFTAAPWFAYMVDTTSGTVTATLPAANVAGQALIVKRVAGTNPVTIVRAGSDTIGPATTTADITLDNEVWELVSSGSGQWNLVGGNKTLASLDGRFAALTDSRIVAQAGDSLTAGEFVPRDRFRLVSNVATVTSGTLALTYFTADKTETISTLTAYTGTTAAAATPTLCRMGIYSVAANGNLTLVASTPNDTTLFAATVTGYAKALSTPLSKVAGQRYATAVLVVSATTMPSFHGIQLLADTPTNTIVQLAPAVAGRVTGQTDLPASATAGVVSGFHGIVAMLLS